MSRPVWLVALAAVALAPSASNAQAVRSVYTELSEQTCRVLQSSLQVEGTGEWSSSLCPGVLGYQLMLQYGDNRENLSVRAPDGGEQDLRLWEVVGSGFSSLGERAEWRLRARARAPHAVIVRYVLEDPENDRRRTSWLVVSHLTGARACVTDRVAPGPRQNEVARRLADEPGRRCLDRE